MDGLFRRHNFIVFWCKVLKMFHLPWFHLLAFSCWDCSLISSVLIIGKPCHVFFLGHQSFGVNIGVSWMQTYCTFEIQEFGYGATLLEAGEGGRLLCLLNFFFLHCHPLKPWLGFACLTGRTWDSRKPFPEAVWFKMLPDQMIEGWQGLVTWIQVYSIIYADCKPL